ncbi:MAG: YidC/Oxa1 family membrane protein insertase, partial [Gammaproteobacteria bacterium]|nr:YidC/Oxa1 family membrane protein insertase [Gammaproteobacteria bacterium]
MIHNPGLGIIMLALLLQAVLWPVSMKAIELWAGVRETRARLAPQFRSVDSRYRGQQRAEHITAIYRQENVHPLYQLKGFAGLLVLIPVLVCAFQALAENIWLYEMKFLWIADLSLPDAAIELHFGLPLFGNHVNLLPFIVFAISLSASWMLHRSRARTLSNPIRWRKVYGLPILFLILFYTVPAGMVLFLAVTIAIITLQLLIRSKRAPG